MGYFPFVFFCIAIIIALIAKPLEKIFHLSYPAILIIIGFIFSQIFIFLGIDTGIRTTNLQAISEYLFIPILLFGGAYHFSPTLLLRKSISRFLIVFFTTLISMSVIAVAVYYSVNRPEFAWIAAFLTGSALTTTGIYAIEDYLHWLKIPKRIIQILHFESLFSAVIAIAFFKFFLNMAMIQSEMNGAYWILNFIMLVMGGLLIGIIFGWISLWLLKFIKDSFSQNLLILSTVYLAYILASTWEVSAGVAVFSLGIMLGSLGQKHISNENDFSNKLWNFGYLIIISAIFLLLGAVMSGKMFINYGIAMIIAIIAIFVSRSIGVYSGVHLFNLTHPDKSYTLSEQSVLISGGIRGALAVALAFTLPSSLTYSWIIQSIVFGVVLFTLLIQVPLIGVLWRKVTIIGKNRSGK